MNSGKYGLSLAAVLGIGLWSTTATAELVQLDVTYTGGEVIFGPISAGLDELPDAVCLAVLYAGSTDPGTVGLDDTVSASLEFGDGLWTELDTFTMEVGGDKVVKSLSYFFNLIDTATVLEALTFNFPLTIMGTDIASGEDFQYVYANSSQSLTAAPPCPWDCGDFDGEVGIVDFLALLSEWGSVGTSCDVDGSGVGITDFLELLAEWGPCSAPIIGACCFGDGTCTVLPQAVCAAAGGTYQGDGTDCASVSCTGACCVPSGSCFVATADFCNADSDNCYQGTGTTCLDVECAVRECSINCPDGACEVLCPCGETAVCLCFDNTPFCNCLAGTEPTY